MERGLLREHEYDAERAERGARADGALSRRGLLKAGLAGLGVAAVGGGLATSPGALGTARAFAADTPIAKPLPPSLFIPRGTNAEMRWEAMKGQGYVTPIDRFFIRNHTTTPRIDAATWRLRVHGTGVSAGAVAVARGPAGAPPGHRHPGDRVCRQRAQLLRHPAGHARPPAPPGASAPSASPPGPACRSARCSTGPD